MLSNLVRHHQLISFFVLVLLLSWGIYSVLPVPGGLGEEPAAGEAAGVSGILSFVKQFTPLIAGLVVARLAGGKAGVKAMKRQALNWRADPKWYLIVLVMFPLALLAFSTAISAVTNKPFISSDVDLTFIIGGFLLIGLLGPLGEELYGWRGFALPKVMGRFNDVTGSIVLGIIWNIWHVPPWGMIAQGIDVGNLLTSMLFTIALSFLMVRAYRASDSLLLAGFGMHAAYNTANLFPAVSVRWGVLAIGAIAAIDYIAKARTTRS